MRWYIWALVLVIACALGAGCLSSRGQNIRLRS